jgi:intergrase/recombinase
MVIEFHIWARITDSISRSLRIYCDNLVVVFIAKNNKNGSQSTHIDIKYLAIREHVKKKKVIVEHIRNELMITNSLINGMPSFKFKDHIVKMELGFII